MLLKNLYYKLAAKVNNINHNEFVLKIKFDTDKSNLENIITDGDKKKTPATSGLAKIQIIMQKFLKQKTKYAVFSVQILLLH